MNIASKTINHRVYAKIDGVQKFLDNCTDVKLPKIEFLTDTIKGAGIMGEIDLPTITSLKSMSFSANFRITGGDAVAITAPGLQEFEVRFATELFDSTNGTTKVLGSKIIMKCLSKMLEVGKIETASSMDGSTEYEVLYYRHIMNGVELCEIDKLNYKYVIRGTDYATGINSVL